MRKEDVESRFGLRGGALGDIYLTAPAPCPYLPGRTERKAFAFLRGEGARSLNDALSRRGFRRSQNVLYTPACDACRACVPVRIPVAEFAPSRSQRRVARRNAHVERALRPPKATSEQYSVLRGYLDARHAEGGMADMTVLDFAAMVEETSVDTATIEYREPGPRGAGAARPDEASTASGRLIACALTDRLSDGLSMVYSFFDPDDAARSLGVYMILDHVALACALGLPYVYLGYWVPGSSKMDYKARYAPLERLTPDGWRRFTPGAA